MGRIKRCNGYILIKWAIGGVMMTLHKCFIKGRLASRLANPTTPSTLDGLSPNPLVALGGGLQVKEMEKMEKVNLFEEVG